jgi:hypothetical protein
LQSWTKKQKNNNDKANEKSNGSKSEGIGQQKGNNNDGKSKKPIPSTTHDGQHD